jgi:hypothetical protein
MQTSPSPEGEEFTDPLPGTPKTGECLHLIYGAVQLFIILHLYIAFVLQTGIRGVADKPLPAINNNQLRCATGQDGAPQRRCLASIVICM